MTVSAPDVGPFPQSALAANASGQLTDDQHRIWRSNSRGYRKNELSSAWISGTTLTISEDGMGITFERANV